MGWGRRWKSQNRKNVYLSPYVEEPLNSKVIKSFVPELRSRKCFSCFGIPMFYVYMLWTFYVRFPYPYNGHVTVLHWCRYRCSFSLFSVVIHCCSGWGMITRQLFQMHILWWLSNQHSMWPKLGISESKIEYSTVQFVYYSQTYFYLLMGFGYLIETTNWELRSQLNIEHKRYQSYWLTGYVFLRV